MRIHQSSVPEGLVEELEETRSRLHYTSPETLFYCVWLWGETCCGVFGDGENGTYEWFIRKGRQKILDTSNLETSDCGYGSSSVALRDVLVKMEE